MAKPDKLESEKKNILDTRGKHRKAHKFGDQLISRNGIIVALIDQKVLLEMFSWSLALMD